MRGETILPIGETIKTFQGRLRREGRYQEMMDRCREMVANGDAPNSREAQIILCTEYLPLKGEDIIKARNRRKLESLERKRQARNERKRAKRTEQMAAAAEERLEAVQERRKRAKKEYLIDRQRIRRGTPLPGEDPFRDDDTEGRPAVPEDFQDTTPPADAMEWAVTAVGVHAKGVEVKQSDAPGPFAWALFAWGKKNFEKLVAMFRSETSKKDTDDAMVKECDKQNEEIYEMLREHLEESKKELARLRGEA